MSASGKILFVDDDSSLRKVVPIALSRDGFAVDTAANGAEALAMFAGGGYDLVLQDVRMPGMGGLELLERLKEADAGVPVVVMTAFSTWDTAVGAMRLGAFDYIKKPFDNDELRRLARRAVDHSQKRMGQSGVEEPRLIGSSKAIKEVLSVIAMVAMTDSTVLVEGESGSGKELIAGLVHSQSHRRAGPFIAVNCGGFSETLLESELFGHVRGSFTGAVADKRGLLELADGGTFFLDEIGEMSLATQVRLLRVLETRTFLPVGGETPRRTDTRFVAATNRNLAEMADLGSFRHDLYYRLNVIPIRLPPLRERQDDIPLLAGRFLALYSARNKKELAGFDPLAMEALMGYDWPGNVRELQNVVQRAVSMARGDRVMVEDLGGHWRAGSTVAVPIRPISGGEAKAQPQIPVLGEKGIDLESEVAKFEAWYIARALEMTGNNLTQAADLLGITFRSIRYKVQKLNLGGGK